MNEEKMMILNKDQEGKISANEAAMLLEPVDAVGDKTEKNLIRMNP